MHFIDGRLSCKLRRRPGDSGGHATELRHDLLGPWIAGASRTTQGLPCDSRPAIAGQFVQRDRNGAVDHQHRVMKGTVRCRLCVVDPAVIGLEMFRRIPTASSQIEAATKCDDAVDHDNFLMSCSTDGTTIVVLERHTPMWLPPQSIVGRQFASGIEN